MDILIIDDEMDGRLVMEHLLTRHCPEVKTIRTAASLREGTAAISEREPDLLFLDIELQDGSGFDLLERIGPPGFDVCFVTAYDHHSLRAFRFGAIHYILKPVIGQQLRAVMDRVSKRRLPATPAIPNETSLALPTREGFTLVKQKDIVRLQADTSYTHVHFSTGPAFLAAKNLSYFEDLLDSNTFFRSHHRHIVHLAHVKKYFRGRGGQIEMSDGSIIEVSVRKKDAFLEALAAFAKGI